MNRAALFCWALVALAGGWMLFAPAPGSGNQEPAVKSTVDSYLRAFATGDGKAACDKLTDSAREAVAGLGKRMGAGDCESTMERTRKIGGSKVRAIASHVRVRKVDIDGGRAKVILRAEGQDSVAELERTEKGWKISSLPKG
jgi:hypothetical protein